MNRRQFFKTLAATAAGVVAVGVAPRVVGGDKKVPFKPNRAQKLIVGRWDRYYKDYPLPVLEKSRMGMGAMNKKFEVMRKQWEGQYF